MAIHQPATIDNLRALLAEGLSRSQIGARLGMTCGAVKGLVFRMQRGGVVVPRSLPARRVPVKAKPQPQYDHSMRSTGTCDLPVEVTANAVPLIALGDHGCHWPVAGEGIGTLFCGADRGGHASYCRHHAARSVAVEEPGVFVRPRVMALAS